ncbi:MAG: glycoside hydrolase family 3 N-terminal domain-containing protein [Chloroflexota bacterium]
MKILRSACAIALLSSLLIQSCSTGTGKPQPVLGTRTVNTLEKHGLKFKDLNKNGKLDRYEDWRLSSPERSVDLLAQMSLEEKVGFMLINTTNMVGSARAEAAGLQASDFDEGNLPAAQGASAMAAREAPRQGGRQPQQGGRTGADRFGGMMRGVTGTSKAVKDYHNRHFILRVSESPEIMAEWANKLQALCESEPLGIPALVASNPRNHITTNAALGTSLGTTSFSVWPGELGLSAMHDLELTHQFADIARQEWTACGIRKGYMYMADLATEPRWSRVNGTLGEDAEWVAKMIKEIVLGFQGEKLGPGSVAMTTKHFPGGGSGDDGQDSHFDFGKREVYPGGMFENNLIPFKAAIEAGTSAIMPYYSLPFGTEYEEVGYAYNKGVINDLLRTKLGFKGIINSDTGPIDNMPWGVESLTIPERYRKALEAGVNIFSGISDPSVLIDAVNSGTIDKSLIDSSVVKLLNEKFEMGLFENPYVDPAAAKQTVNNAQFREKADLALRKSIVLLRNVENFLPLKQGTKVYLELLGRNAPDGKPEIFAPENNKYPVVFVSNPAEADVVVLWMQPAGNSLFASTGAPISISLSKCSINTDYVNRMASRKPAILVVNYTNPWVINEVYNDKMKSNVKGVLATFGTTADALVDVLTGKFNPAGKMPFSTPVSDMAVTNQKEDVPGYMEGEGYALFNINEGLSYNK